MIAGASSSDTDGGGPSVAEMQRCYAEERRKRSADMDTSSSVADESVSTSEQTQVVDASAQRKKPARKKSVRFAGTAAAKALQDYIVAAVAEKSPYNLVSMLREMKKYALPTGPFMAERIETEFHKLAEERALPVVVEALRPAAPAVEGLRSAAPTAGLGVPAHATRTTSTTFKEFFCDI